MINIFPKHKWTLLWSLVAGMTVTILSLVAFQHPSIEAVLFGAVIVGVLVASAKKPQIAFYALAVEMIVSSMGRLLIVSVGGQEISLRMGLFVVALLIGAVEWKRNPQRSLFTRKLKQSRFARYDFVLAGLLFAVLLVFGIANGFVNANAPTDIINDANNYIFYAVLLVAPVFIAARKDVAELTAVALGALTALWVNTFALFVVFSHRVVDLEALYKWTRETRVAEVTIQDEGWVRVFYQSHVFALLILFIAAIAFYALWKKAHSDKWLWTWALFSSMSMVLISFSRSFWVAAVAGVVLSLVALWRTRAQWQSALWFTLGLVGSFAVSIAFVFVLIQIPFPQSPQLSLDAVEDRASNLQGEVALGSRFELLNPLKDQILTAPFFGTGFGTTVTYETQDPRFIDVNQSSTYETFVFEWGYLDTLTETGAIGLIVYLVFLFVILRRLWTATCAQQDATTRALLLGLVVSALLLAIVHAFTPFLNHPLGIFWVIILATIGVVVNPKYESTKRIT